ncbi:hypothetical protein CFBP6625_24240 (plasmid) [Agrobacterium tumefaciens]|uniref:Uncharacterized protein n=1 Tax=Brucella lupini TaxID=255457 RepID=A0AB34DFT6_9HYPH|nr:hypothetical protein F9L03_20665 [Brucella lupini]QCM13568.1 hypothetical protein CFBP6625_24240 [Agrobacterium tumefaciens]
MRQQSEWSRGHLHGWRQSHTRGDTCILCEVRSLQIRSQKSWPLDDINNAISGVTSGDGGFTSYLVEI